MIYLHPPKYIIDFIITYYPGINYSFEKKKLQQLDFFSKKKKTKKAKKTEFHKANFKRKKNIEVGYFIFPLSCKSDLYSLNRHQTGGKKPMSTSFFKQSYKTNDSCV